MKIGIISINMHSLGLNYGCPLHSFAFQQFLFKHGIDNTIINYKPNYNDNFNQRHPAVFYERKVKVWNQKLKLAEAKGDNEEIRIAKEKIETHSKNFQYYQLIEEERAARCDKFWDFIERYYKKTERCYNVALLEIEELDYDCYICVSDVIWHKNVAFGYEPGFYLASSCMDNKWKIAYAASGYTTYSDEDLEMTRGWIKDIDFVSCRENSMQKKIQNSIRSDVTWVVDPVLLHDAEFYMNYTTLPSETDYLLLYYVEDNAPFIAKKALEYAKLHGLKIIEISDRPFQSPITKEQNDVEVIWKYNVGVEEWLGYIRCAHVVFTNSFHMCCFSAIYERSLYAQKRVYDKVSMFLSSLGMEDRVIDEDEDFSKQPEKIIDWITVRQKLNERRKKSEHFILNAIYTAEQQKHPIRSYEEEKRKQTFPVFYNIGVNIRDSKNILPEFKNKGSVYIRPKSMEFCPEYKQITNESNSAFEPNMFAVQGKTFVGWRIRISLQTEQVVLLKNGKLKASREYNREVDGEFKIFQPGEKIPYIPLKRIRALVLVAVWK